MKFEVNLKLKLMYKTQQSSISPGLRTSFAEGVVHIPEIRRGTTSSEGEAHRGG
jgi:hypothetical protein